MICTGVMVLIGAMSLNADITIEKVAFMDGCPTQPVVPLCLWEGWVQKHTMYDVSCVNEETDEVIYRGRVAVMQDT